MPIVPATATRLTFDTVATRNPAAITGTAIGSSTLTSRRNEPKPIAVAACVTSSGTDPNPSATTRTSSATEYTLSAIGTCSGSSDLSPNSGGTITNSAMDGIVYS